MFEQFNLSPDRLPISVFRTYALIKKAYAVSNPNLGADRTSAIVRACDEMLGGRFDDECDLSVWGSATHTNMTVNRLIAKRASELCARSVHPHDHVNAGQSTNDTFLTMMHICMYLCLARHTIPALNSLIVRIEERATEWSGIVKVGRTHMMDAVPIRLSQEWRAHAANLRRAVNRLSRSRDDLLHVPIGGTAVGSGLNAVCARSTAKTLGKLTGIDLRISKNSMATQSMLDHISTAHASLLQVAHALKKMAMDVRLQISGPSGGLNELELQTSEKGSSIMPAKINATGAEALIMVWMHVMGANTTVQTAAASGEFQLNVFRPLIIHNCLSTCRLLEKGAILFGEEVILRVRPRVDQIKETFLKSHVLGTAFSPRLGYDATAEAIRNTRDGLEFMQRWPADIQRDAIHRIQHALSR